VGLLVACALVALWMARPHAGTAAVVLPPRAAMGAPAPRLQPAILRVAPDRPAVMPRAERRPPRTGAEVCGWGEVPLADDDPFGVQHIPRGDRSAALDALDAAMLASADEAVQAAALLIGARTRAGESVARTDRLARLAAHTRDPRVYAIALEGCAGSDVAACALLSRAQWARLDPDNVLPWLALAGEARLQDDPAAEEAAIFRAAQSHRSDPHAGLLPSLVGRAAPGGERSLARTLGLAASWSVQAAWGLPPTEEAWRYCGDSTASGREPVCDALAGVLVGRGGGLLDLTIGVAIGERLGWPEARVRSLRDERDALGEASRFQTAALDLSCDSVERLQGWMQRLAADGETQAARERLAEVGGSVTLWSEQHRRNLALAAATAEAAASGATP